MAKILRFKEECGGEFPGFNFSFIYLKLNIGEVSNQQIPTGNKTKQNPKRADKNKSPRKVCRVRAKALQSEYF